MASGIASRLTVDNLRMIVSNMMEWDDVHPSDMRVFLPPLHPFWKIFRQEELDLIFGCKVLRTELIPK